MLCFAVARCLAFTTYSYFGFAGRDPQSQSKNQGIYDKQQEITKTSLVI
jgi:hypothetical protein